MNEEDDGLQRSSEELDYLPDLHFEDNEIHAPNEDLDPLLDLHCEEHGIPASIEEVNPLPTLHCQDDNLQKSSEKLDALPDLLHCEEDDMDSDSPSFPYFSKGTALKMYHPEVDLHGEKNHHNYTSTLTPNTMTSKTECPNETGHNCLQTKRTQFDELKKDEYHLSKDTIDGSEGDSIPHNIVIGLQQNKLLEKVVSNVPQLHESMDIHADKILQDRKSIGQENTRLGTSSARTKKKMRPESERKITPQSLDVHTFLIVNELTGEKRRLRIDDANSVAIKTSSRQKQVEETEFISVSSVKKKEQNEPKTQEYQNVAVEHLVTLPFELEVQSPNRIPKRKDEARLPQIMSHEESCIQNKREHGTYQEEQTIIDEKFVKCTNVGQDESLKTTYKEPDKQRANSLQIHQVGDINVPKCPRKQIIIFSCPIQSNKRKRKTTICEMFIKLLGISTIWLNLFKDSTITVFPVQNANSKQICKGDGQKNGREEERTAQNDDPNRETHNVTFTSNQDCIRNIVETQNRHFLTLSVDNGEHSNCLVPSGRSNSPNELPMTIGQGIPEGSILVPSGRDTLHDSSMSRTERVRYGESFLIPHVRDRSALNTMVISELHRDFQTPLVACYNCFTPNHRRTTTRQDTCSEGIIAHGANLVVVPGHNSFVRISRSIRVIDRPRNDQIQNHPVVPSQGSGGITCAFFNMIMTNLCPILPFLLAISLWQREESTQRLFEEASQNVQLRHHEANPYEVLRQIALDFNSANPDFGRGIALWVRLVRQVDGAVETEMTTYDMYSDQLKYVTTKFRMDLAVNCNGESCKGSPQTPDCIILPHLRPNMSFNDMLWEYLQRCGVCGNTASITLRYRTPLLFFNLARHPFSSSQDIPSCIDLPIEGSDRRLRYRRILVTFHRDNHFIGLIWLHTERCLALYDCNDIHPSNPQCGVLIHYDYDPPGATMQLAVFALEDNQEDNSNEFLYS